MPGTYRPQIAAHLAHLAQPLKCEFCGRDKKVISTNGSGRWVARVYACPDWPDECALAATDHEAK